MTLNALTAPSKPESSKTHNEREFERIRAEDVSLLEFVKTFWRVIEPGRTFVPGNHIEAICQHLEAVSHGDILRLLVNMPPRHAKSTIISVLWPAWAWIRKPSLRWLCASYALNLATRDNVKCRRLIQSPLYQERYGHILHLAKDQNAKMKFETTFLGYRMAVSVGSSATGEGGDILLLDDPHAIDEKESDVKREAALDWFNNTWATRLNDQQTGAMVVVGQRIHHQDVSGHILQTSDGEWTHLNLPSLFEPQRACQTQLADGRLFWCDWRKQEGELLWPERFPKGVLDRAKVRHGALGFSALYQQNPVPSEGGRFKEHWFRHFTQTNEAYILHRTHETKTVLKSACWKFGNIDLAISKRDSADYTVMTIWAVTPEKDLLLLHVSRDRLSDAEQIALLQSLHGIHKPDFWKVETVAYQQAFFQQALRKGIPCKSYKPDVDKERRAATAAVWCENEKAFWPEHAEWLDAWKTELLRFPKGEHDDQVDNFSMAALEVCGLAVPLADEPMPDAPPPAQSLQEILQENPFDFAARMGMFDDD